MESNDMIDPQKRTFEAMAIELDRANAENAALKSSLSAPQAAGWKEVRYAPADKDVLLYCPHLNATNPERMEVGYYRTTAGGTMHSWATHWMELPRAPTAPVPRLSEQEVVTDKTLNTERKDDSAYQAGRKQDAPTVEAIREQFENWLTGEGNWPHLKYKNFGGSYITDESCMKWDAYKAGFKAALQNAAK